MSKFFFFFFFSQDESHWTDLNPFSLLDKWFGQEDGILGSDSSSSLHHVSMFDLRIEWTYLQVQKFLTGQKVSWQWANREFILGRLPANIHCTWPKLSWRKINKWNFVWCWAHFCTGKYIEHKRKTFLEVKKDEREKRKLNSLWKRTKRVEQFLNSKISLGSWKTWEASWLKWKIINCII